MLCGGAFYKKCCDGSRLRRIDKIKHWCGLSAIFARGASPVLEFRIL
jgi:hypothetical protein